MKAGKLPGAAEKRSVLKYIRAEGIEAAGTEASGRVYLDINPLRSAAPRLLPCRFREDSHPHPLSETVPV